MEKIWMDLYNAAKAVQNDRKISDYISAGCVAAAAILPDGSSGAPCGACRELMVQLMPGKYQNVEILMDYNTGRIMTLGELTPEWWIK